MDSIRNGLIERLNHIGRTVILTDSEIDYVLSMEQTIIDIEEQLDDLQEELQCLKDIT